MAGRSERLTEELLALRGRIEEGGGAARIARQHAQGKKTARERIDLLLDEGTDRLEIGRLVAHDRYDGEAPAAGVVTVVGIAEGREVVVVANDATVKAGSWWPETITKILRAQEIAMRCRVPILYLVDSAGVNLPYQDGVFPGQYGAARIFQYNSIMRRYLKVPQLAAVMGPCIAGGAYLPALSDFIVMVEGTSFMGLGGANLVKGATGQTVDSEFLGGAATHTALSGVAHYRAEDDEACIALLRRRLAELPPNAGGALPPLPIPPDAPLPPTSRPPSDLHTLIPDDHRRPYSMPDVLECILDEGSFEAFQPEHARELLCGTARVGGIEVGVVGNMRGIIPGPKGSPPRFGGIIYTESAEKAAWFIEMMDRRGTPILFLHDVSGFMVGPEAEHSGIIRAGARFVEAMATAGVPKIVVTLNHASGAGYYAMAGQGFDPDFILTLPTGRMGVMEGESAVGALFSGQIEKLKAEGKEPDEELLARMQGVRDAYEAQLDARTAAARGHVDEVVTPEELRGVLRLALRTSLRGPLPHLGAFQLAAGRATTGDEGSAPRPHTSPEGER